MEPTTFDRLVRDNLVEKLDWCIVIKVQRSWIVPGEDRLSYATIIRLVECCREYHWYKDIVPMTREPVIDSICRTLSCEFIGTILVESHIRIRYRIHALHRKGYAMRFIIEDSATNEVRARFDQFSLFYDPIAKVAIAPPAHLTDRLIALLSNDSGDIR